MTVEELIEALQGAPGHYEVWAQADYGLGSVDEDALFVIPEEGVLFFDLGGQPPPPNAVPLNEWRESDAD